MAFVWPPSRLALSRPRWPPQCWPARAVTRFAHSLRGVAWASQTRLPPRSTSSRATTPPGARAP
eukprot:3905862-Prymnesium_polylepis.2